MRIGKMRSKYVHALPMEPAMTNETAPHARVRQVVAGVAILFGIASLAAGWSVLTGRDPGYLVYRPLVVFNTLMGALYIGAGVMAWRRAHADRLAAAGIFIANLLVLGYIATLFRAGTAAVDSVRAMVLRTAVWLVLLLLLTWTRRATRET